MSDHVDQQGFLYQAIADTQATIRAIDVKVGFLLLIVFTPLFEMDKLQPLITETYAASNFQAAMTVILLVLWGLAIFAQFLALFAISNPGSAIVGEAKGTFFGGDLYDVGLFSALCGVRVKAARDLIEEMADLPKTSARIIEELTFEKMKLTYIRTIKAKRANFAIVVTVLWLITCGFTYAFHAEFPC